jgi:hypothetical protein
MKKNLILVSLFTLILLALAVPLAAADGLTFDSAIVELILAGVGGLTVVGITQMVKTWLKVSGVLAYVISGAVSAAATAYCLVKAGAFTIPAFVGYAVFVFLAANGIYKAKA